MRNYRACLNAAHQGDGWWLYCILALGHVGAHQSGGGVIWTQDPSPALCGAVSRPIPPGGPDWVCVLDAGHQGHHTMAEGHHWHGMKVTDA